MSEEAKIIIDETEEVENEDIELSTDGLSEQEIALAKETGFLKEEEEKKEEEKEEEDGEHEKQSESESEEDSEDDEQEEGEEEEVNKDPDNFDEMEKIHEKNEKKFHNTFSPNQKALYFKMKAEKHKRQETEKRLKLLETELEKNSSSVVINEKLKKIQEALKGETVTIESLESIINEEVKEPEKKNELNNAEDIQKKIATKAKFAEDIGQSKYKNFDAISKLAKQVIKNDKTGTYQKLIDDAFVNDNIDESMLVETVVNIARLDPSYQKVSESVDTGKKEKASRVIKNSKKKLSSASVNGASGKTIVSESQITVAQAAKLSTEQWNRLSEKTRERLERGIDPS